MARAWTGFERPTPRPNLENRWSGSENLMDPQVRLVAHNPYRFTVRHRERGTG